MSKEESVDTETRDAAATEGHEETETEQAVEAPDTEIGENPESHIVALQQQLEEAESRAQDYWDRLVRAEAEKDNLRKRAAREAENARTQGLERIAAEMLPVRDSLELGLAAAEAEDADPKKIREGTELTLNMLVQAMDKCGIEPINPEGEKFDPELHQAMSMQESDNHPANTVITVMQKGYRVNSRLLRPAMVVVAKSPEGST